MRKFNAGDLERLKVKEQKLEDGSIVTSKLSIQDMLDRAEAEWKRKEEEEKKLKENDDKEEKSIMDSILEKVEQALNTGAHHIGITILNGKESIRFPEEPRDHDVEIFLNFIDGEYYEYHLRVFTLIDQSWELTTLESGF